jgi:hypothetical protein
MKKKKKNKIALMRSDAMIFTHPIWVEEQLTLLAQDDRRKQNS